MVNLRQFNIFLLIVICMHMLEHNCLQSLMACLKWKSANIPSQLWLTFYFMVKSLIYLKNINIINISSSHFRGLSCKQKDYNLIIKLATTKFNNLDNIHFMSVKCKVPQGVFRISDSCLVISLSLLLLNFLPKSYPWLLGWMFSVIFYSIVFSWYF